jgi:NAD(P)-dependent dehydrogenase (short-subunit alcohol dehydrogenase family)
MDIALTRTKIQRDLEGRVAVITSGARGIGFATTQMMLLRGAHVALWAPGAAIEGPLAALQSGDAVTGSKVDISNEAEITVAFGGAIAVHSKVDILVNSAGIIGDGVPVIDLAP